MSSYSRQALEKFLSTLSIKADRVLGAGDAQQGIKNRVKSFDVSEYKVLDLEQPHESKQSVDLVWDLNEVICWDKESCPKGFYDEYESYDMVFLLEVLEYIYRPYVLFQNIKNLLKTGGICYFSCHFLYAVHSPKEQDYMRLTRYGVEKILKETGFEIEELIPRMAVTNLPQSLFQAEKMKACKGHNHGEVGYICKCRKI